MTKSYAKAQITVLQNSGNVGIGTSTLAGKAGCELDR